MAYEILFGDQVDVAFLDKLVPVDRACYEEAYWGDPQRTVDRFLKNRRSFVFVVDPANGDVAGYINFFPCEEGLYQDNLFRSPVIRDDDIRPDEVAPYRSDANHLFIISMAVHPRYQGTEVIRLLSGGFIDCLNQLRDEGFPVTDIMGTAVSDDGKKALRTYRFREVRTLDDGNVVYLCDGKLLDKLMANDLALRSYRSDLYLMLPLADHRDNLRLPNFLDDWHAGTAEVPGDASERTLALRVIDELRDCIAYECTNEVARELDLAYLGSFDFLQTTDEYAGIKDPSREIVIGHARGHAVLVAHPATHMYLLCVLLPSFPYSVTQMEDQVSYGYLKIRDPEGAPGHRPFYDYLLRRYGLHGCGGEVCVLLLSDKPADDRELQDMLAAEAHENYERAYRICSEAIREASRVNRAQFEHYEAYLSSRAVVYVDKQFSPTVEERIAGFSDYLFIVILTLFQNTALAKASRRVTDILGESADVSPQTKIAIDQEYGRTVRFWEMQNFKYLSSQLEAAQLREAFLNQELRDAYTEHQEYLEHVVSAKNAVTESRNGMIINIVAIILAVAQLQPLFIELLRGFYEELGIEAAYAQFTVNSALLGGILLLVLVVMLNRRRRRHLEQRRA